MVSHKVRYMDTQLLPFIIYTLPRGRKPYWKLEKRLCSDTFLISLIESFSLLVMCFPASYPNPSRIHLTYGIGNKVITSLGLGKIVSVLFFPAISWAHREYIFDQEPKLYFLYLCGNLSLIAPWLAWWANLYSYRGVWVSSRNGIVVSIF